MIINGNLNLSNSSIESLGELKEVHGKIIITMNCFLSDLGKIKQLNNFEILIKGNENNIAFKNLDYLETVVGNLYLENSKELKSIKNLKKVKGNLHLSNCKKLESLNSLEEVNGNVDFEDCKNLKTIENLTSVNGNLFLRKCKKLKSFKNLKEVRKLLFLKGSGITKEYIEKEKLWFLEKCIW